MRNVARLGRVSALLVSGSGLVIAGTILYAFSKSGPEADPARILGAVCIPIGALLLCTGLFFCSCGHKKSQPDILNLSTPKFVSTSLLDYYSDCWSDTAPPSYAEAVGKVEKEGFSDSCVQDNFINADRDKVFPFSDPRYQIISTPS